MTKENLRICSPTQNVHNSRPSTRNKTGVRGVCFDKVKNKWRVGISINKKFKVVGYYEDLNQAITERKRCEKLYYGDFRYQPELN